MIVKASYALVGVLALLTLSACATTEGSEAPATAGSNRPAANAAVKPAAAEPAPVEEDVPLAFGDTKTYSDGLSVTISKGQKFRPSEYASGKGKVFVKYSVTIVNGTAKMFDPGMFSASVQSSNVEGDLVFDSASDIMGSPDTKLLKGREAKFTIGFGVENLKDVVLEARPSFEHESAIFN